MVLLVHTLKEDKVQKEVSSAKFLLTNKIGGYLHLDLKPTSTFQGFYINDGFQLFKTLEQVQVNKKITKVINKFSSVVRERGRTKEEFTLPNNFNSIIYELENYNGEITIDLNCRSLFDDSETDRFYNIMINKNQILVNYEKRGDYRLYFAITGKKIKAQKIKEWKSVTYDHDKELNYPHESKVLNAVRIFVDDSTKLIFTAGTDQKKVLEEGDYVFRNINKLKRKQSNSLLYKNNLKKIEERMAFNAALNSLNGLISTINDRTGIISGFPFNPEFKLRDELGCLKALGKRVENKIILQRIKDDIRGNWKVPAAISSTLTFPIEDGIGWFYKRFNKKDKLPEALKSWPSDESGFVLNKPLNTWMHTNRRSTRALEHQMLKLNMLKLAGLKEEEKKLRDEVIKQFFVKNHLKDGLDDNTITPNIFLAAYIYPELLSQKEWDKCINGHVSRLWNSWGGFSTIDKKSGYYHPISTGWDKRSMHSGDSHNYLNSIAAIVMNNLNARKYKPHITKIKKNLVEDILWKGIQGHVSELSSSKTYKPAGNLCHAWSAAAFIEMLNTIY